MNYRQLKKQYKRKHGFNPPKGYSRAQIRRGIKRGKIHNCIEAGFFTLGEYAKALATAINDFVASLQEAKGNE